MEKFYEKTLLHNKEADLVHSRDMLRVTLPSRTSKQVNFRIFDDFAPTTEPLKEGVTPEGQLLRETDRHITVKPYGRHVEVTDELDWGVIDNVHKVAAEKLRRQALESIDSVCADAMHSGFGVLYVGNKDSRADITAEDVLTFSDIKRAVRTLEKNNAERFPDGFFHGIIDPDTKYDLTNDPQFVSVAEYQDKSKIEKYEVGTIYSVKFFESTAAKQFETKAKLYGNLSTLSVTQVDDLTYKAAATAVSGTKDEAEIANYIRCMVNTMVAINDVPAYIDSIVYDGTDLIHKMRFVAGSILGGSGLALKPVAAGTGVHSTIVYGKEFCGCVELEGNGKNVSIIIKPAGSSGSDDPLNQRGTIAWKVKGFGAGVLHDNYGVRLEHGVSI
jgi:N4-gp56 family major capsid protein